MDSLKKLLQNYSVLYPYEDYAKITLKFLKQRNCFSNTNFNGHFTASAWIVNQHKNKVLMTHHKKLNMWLQLGGHADGECDLLNAALREAKEESGIESFKIISNQIFDLDIHDIPNIDSQPSHRHYDVRFLFEANSENEKVIVSEESNDVAWIDLSKACEKNSESSIKRMVEKTLNKFKKY
tara:strand:- start:2335 stop:2877 length:543 start_codon:yes stop_codon:yes gene_type:complete